MKACLALATLACAACSVTGYEEAFRVSSDETAALVAAAPLPDLTPRVVPVGPSRIVTLPDGRRRVRLDLQEALRLSALNNLRFLREGEDMNVQLLSLEVLRHSWQPTINPITGLLSYSSSPDVPHTTTQTATAVISQKLPLGGIAAASWIHSGSQPPGPDSYSGRGTLSYTQPLLRGAGRYAALEELVGAERAAVYTRRRFAFNRIALFIDTVESYYGLLQQEKTIQNLERNLERARTLHLQATIKERFGQVTRTDVFQSQLQVTNAENDLSIAREQLLIARDAFKVDLGLQAEDELDLAQEKIEYRPLTLVQEEAVESAFRTNPVWLEIRDRVDDARRSLVLADNATLPKVDATVAYSWLSDVEPHPIGDYDAVSRTLSVIGVLEIPIDPYPLRRNYQKAVIAARQAERDFLRSRDRLVKDIQTLFTQLRQAEASMKFQQRSIADSERAVALAEFDYLRARKSSLDVTTAQDRLIQAQNAYERTLLTARITQLRLLHFVGRLQVDEEGAWLQ